MIMPYELLSATGQYIAHLRFDWRHQSVLAPTDPATGKEREDGPIDHLWMFLIASRPCSRAELNQSDWGGDREIMKVSWFFPARILGNRRAGHFVENLG